MTARAPNVMGGFSTISDFFAGQVEKVLERDLICICIIAMIYLSRPPSPAKSVLGSRSDPPPPLAKLLRSDRADPIPFLARRKFRSQKQGKPPDGRLGMVGTLREPVSRLLILFLVDSLVGLVILNAEQNTFLRPRGLDSFRAFSPHGSYTGDRRIIAFQPRFDVCAQEMGCIRVRGGSLESDEIGRDAAEQSLQGWFEERVKDVHCARRGLAGEGIFTQDAAADHRLAEGSNSTDEETAICNEVRMCDPLDSDTEADSADARALVEYAAALSRMGPNSTTEALETIERALSIRPSLASALALSARLQLQPELSEAVDGGFALKERPRCPAGPTKVSRSESEPSKMLLANAVGLEALVLGAEARMRAGDEVGMMRLLSQAWQSNERRQAEEEIREQRAELKSVCRFRDELQNTLRSVRERVDKRSIQEGQVLRQLALANAQLRATSARLLEAGRLLVRLRLLRAHSAQLNDDSALACSTAEQELRAAVALDPAHPLALLRLARLLHARGAVPGDPSGTQQQWAATVECLYAGAIRIHPSQGPAHPRLPRGQAPLAMRPPNSERLRCAVADRAAFVFPEALCGLGNLSWSRGEVQKAKRLFAQAHSLYPENLEAALSLATLHRRHPCYSVLAQPHFGTKMPHLFLIVHP
jgi:tetratricopeptide (TPR) repeat protein